MDNTEQLISSLAGSLKPAKPSVAPAALFGKWLLGCTLYVALVLCFMGLRSDIVLKLHAGAYVAELTALFFLMASAGASAAVLSFPDMFQKRWLAFVPTLPFIAFVAVLTFEWLSDVPPSPQPVHGAECLFCITCLSLLPGGWMLYILRKQAGVHYYISGAVALIAASSVGCITLRLSEKTDSIHHLLQWHYLPMLGFALVGLVLGRIFLKW